MPDGGTEFISAGAVGMIALALIAFIRFFLVRQIRDLRNDVAELQKERSEKHKANNDVARTVMALDLVQRLARECTCSVLSPLEEIIERLVTELETLPHRRIPVDPEGAS